MSNELFDDTFNEEIFNSVSEKVKVQETILISYQIVQVGRVENNIIDTYPLRIHGLQAKDKAFRKAKMFGYCTVYEMCKGGIKIEVLHVNEPMIVDKTELHKSGHKRRRVVLR